MRTPGESEVGVLGVLEIGEWRGHSSQQYCHSCGFHPLGKNHTSENCGYKKSNHDENATWTNQGTGGSTVWPTKVQEDQKTHESYAGKSVPTN